MKPLRSWLGNINVKGLGVVEIEGDKPTQQEADDIKKALTVLNVDGISNAVGDEEAQKYSEGSSFGRILTEVGGSILGSIAGGGFTLPGLVRQVGMRSMQVSMHYYLLSLTTMITLELR